MSRATADIVGRESERRRLRGLAEAVAAGEGAALVVMGAAGSGKSTLLAELAATAPCTVLRATGAEGESGLPFAALDALLRPVIDHREALAPPQRAALEGALALAAPSGGGAFAVAAATLALLGAAAAHEPLLVVVDDAHWIDESSRDALLFACRRLGRDPVGVVLAARPEHPGAQALRGLPALTLDPLGDAEAAAILDRISDGRLPPETVAPLVAAAGGNPLLLHELFAELEPGQAAGHEPLAGPPRPGATAEAVLARRIDALPTATTEALLVAATAGDAPPTVVAAALMARGATLDDLLPAEAAGLLALDAAGLRFRHPLARSVAYHRAAPAARRAAHAAVAAALPSGDPHRAWHGAAAATLPDEGVASELAALAERSAALGGHAQAARALRRAADLTPDLEQRGRRLYAAADAFEEAGMGGQALGALDDAAGMPLSPETGARLRGLRAHVRLRLGDPQEARDELLREARALASVHPVAAARFLLEAAYASVFLGDAAECERHAAEAVALLDDPAEPTSRAALAMHAAALVVTDRAARARPLFAEVHRRLAGEPDGAPITGAMEVYGLMVLAEHTSGRREEASALADRLIADSRAVGALTGLPYLLIARATIDVHGGRLTEAVAAAAEAVELAELTAQPVVALQALGVRAAAHALRGDAAAAAADAQAALDRLGAAGLGLRAEALHALGMVALARGRFDDAVGRFRDAVASRRDDGWTHPDAMHAEAELIEALIRRGDAAEAGERLAPWEAAAQRAQADVALAHAARCRALLAPDAEIDRASARALAAAGAVGAPFLEARALLAHGERLRRARRGVEARAPLREAVERLDRHGYADWAVWARRELRATGGMVPQRRGGELGELTPHEAQVAAMAARGLTNREIAAALFLAPKTIEHHLSAIYRKLGVRRRAELAPMFAREATGPG